MPENSSYTGREELAEELAKSHCDEGWKPDLYFRSQNSFRTNNNITTAHTRQYRYVEPGPEFETIEEYKAKYNAMANFRYKEDRGIE